MEETFLNPQQPPLDPEAASDLTRVILARTSGSPCQRLQTLACDFVDGELDEGQGSLVRAHLEHCKACSVLVATLGEMKSILPALAQVDPGPWFTQRILRATLRAPRREFGFELRGTWSKLLHRPRIALEAAYLGAAAGVMGLYLPLPALPPAGSPPAIVRTLSPQHLVQPLLAPGRRMAGSLLQVEQRTASALKGAFLPRGASESQAVPSQTRWQVVSSKIRTVLKRGVGFLRASTKGEKESSKPTNP